ncbi:aspartate-semialdehyde dehydrogenase [Candidatus Kaiserbacteria bacterium]|nr:aspartate-semialdehyde dehydrogenase [Candidatus Kaiserbacteria bacterium]
MTKLAVVGATGAVGREVLNLLTIRNFPLTELRVFASSRSAGSNVHFRGNDLIVEDLAGADFSTVEIAIFDTPDDVAAKYAPIARDAGCIVIDNSAAFRMDDDVPLVIPEINGRLLEKRSGIIANPNCTTAIGLMGLWPLHKEFGLERVFGSSYQAVSGAGESGIAQLNRETREYVTGVAEEIGVPAFPHPILRNVIPHIGRFDANGNTSEEMKFEREGRKIMNLPHFSSSLTCVRVPVMRSHSVDMIAFFEKRVSVRRAHDALREASGVTLKDDTAKGLYPMPLTATESFDCEVGRVRMVPGFQKALHLFVSGDQLWKGAALNAVQIAERLVSG